MQSSEMDCIVKLYNQYHSLSKTAAKAGISLTKVRKILITMGAYENNTSRKVQSLYNSGSTIERIADELGCSVTYINSYLPYSKALYDSSSPSQNALKIRICRNKPLIF